MNTIKPIETLYQGHRFRSRTEARWAVFFTHAGIRFEYEKDGYSLPSGWYLPDFFLPDLSMWLEVKGQEPTAAEMSLLSELALATGFEALLAVGAPEPKDQIIRPSAQCDEEDDARYYFCDDRKNENEFWLVSDDGGSASSIGPARGPDHGSYPCVRNATQAGYAAAKAERFDRR